MRVTRSHLWGRGGVCFIFLKLSVIVGKGGGLRIMPCLSDIKFFKVTYYGWEADFCQRFEHEVVQDVQVGCFKSYTIFVLSRNQLLLKLSRERSDHAVEGAWEYGNILPTPKLCFFSIQLSLRTQSSNSLRLLHDYATRKTGYPDLVRSMVTFKQHLYC